MLPLFLVTNIEAPELLDQEAHHAHRVLRMKVGEELLTTDGLGRWARCQITDSAKHQIKLAVIEQGRELKPEREISVLQALPKSDRAREAVELLTASGAEIIYPWLAARSIGKESAKWQVAAVEASKQSRRFNFPRVAPEVDTRSALEICKEFEQVLICHESATVALSQVVKPAKRTLIIIGPEGGITDEELEMFKGVGGQVIKLGQPIFRSAHAGMAAVSAVSAIMKVW